MEDAHTVEHRLGNDLEERKCTFLGVYDGHGGRLAADYVAEHLPGKCVRKNGFFEDPEDCVRNAILELEEEFLEKCRKNDWNDGTTIVIAVIIDNYLTVANVGDSECIICSDGKGVALSEIHNPSKNDEEIERVDALGGRIFRQRLGHPLLNVNYFNLGLSRAM